MEKRIALNEDNDGASSSLQINVISYDYYMETVTELLDSQKVADHKFPVIRIFGSSLSGQQSCVHIHGYFPYFYIRPELYDDASFQDEAQIRRYLQTIRQKLNQALTAKSRKEKGNYGGNYVYSLEVASKKTMYGYWAGPLYFIKISLFNPDDVNKAVSLIEEGVLGAPMQPYESHLPYLLKFTTDRQVQPMGFLPLGKTWRIRSPLPESHTSEMSTSAVPPSHQHKSQGNSQSSNNSSNSTSKRDNFMFTQPNARSSGPLDDFASPLSHWLSPSPPMQSTKKGPQRLHLDNIDAHNTWDAYSCSSLSLLNPATEISSSNCEIVTEKKYASYLVDPLNNMSGRKQYVFCVNKRAVSQLEVDVHVDALQPAHAIDSDSPVGSQIQLQVASGFGAELWEEEAKRRISDGLSPLDSPPVAPSSDRRHWPVYENEKEFVFRFRRLVAKGRALSELNRVISTQQSNQSAQSAEKSAYYHDPIEIIQRLSQSEDDADLFDNIDYFNEEIIDTNINQALFFSQSQLQTQVQSESQAQSQLLLQSSSQLLTQEQARHDTSDYVSETDSVATLAQIGEEESPLPPIINSMIASSIRATQQHYSTYMSSREQDEMDVLDPSVEAWLTQQLRIDEEGLSQTVRKSQHLHTRHLPEQFLSQLSGRDNIDSDEERLNDMTRVTNGKRTSHQYYNRYDDVDEEDLEDDYTQEIENILSCTQKDHNDKTTSPTIHIHSSPNPNPIPAQPHTPETVKRKLDQDIDESFNSNRKTVLQDLTVQCYMDDSLSIHSALHLRPNLSPPPNASSAMASLHKHGMLQTINMSQFFGDPRDLDGKESKTVTIGGARVVIKSAVYLPSFHSHCALADLLCTASQSIPTSTVMMIDDDLKAKALVNTANEKALVVYDVDNDTYDVQEVSASDALIASIPSIKELRYLLTPLCCPPTSKSIRIQDVNLLVPEIAGSQADRRDFKSQVSSPTQTASRTVDMRVANGKAAADRSDENISKKTVIRICSMELFCISRINDNLALTPDPKFDSIEMIVYVVEEIFSDAESEHKRCTLGIINKLPTNNPVNTDTLTEDKLLRKCRLRRNFIQACIPSRPCQIYVELSEECVLTQFANSMRELDVDFYVGYDVQKSSFGYLVDRGTSLGINMLQMLSRIPDEIPSRRNEHDKYSEEHDSGIFITGKVVLNCWRLMSQELKLANYTYHTVAAHLLNETIPIFSFMQLTRWYKTLRDQRMTITHLLRLCELNLALLDKVDFFRRTAESARLYGIDFYSVISRGSQYRVEASLSKIARKYGFIAISPSPRKREQQAPMAVIPLVMEPRSGFYNDPVVVLDFQSLYPSMIIAYNICFSTIIGKLNHGTSGLCDTSGRLGTIPYPEKHSAKYLYHQQGQRSQGMDADMSLNSQMDELYNVSELPFLAPNGSIFCSKSTRRGLLPLMLQDILETRFMIKRALKRYGAKNQHREFDILSRVLDARQLSIKNLANVTYGYTSAGFSGRMPMAEVADAIVQCGRSTLEWAMKYISEHKDWKARVVYGDTDSMFVLLPGRTKDQAIELGQQMAAEVSASCPANVVLKYEKVYHPCILASKKRYVGRSFETLVQTVGHFDAKGIESVRRDQCPMTIKIQEKATRILFDTCDLSQVKEYLLRQWTKIQQGHLLVPLNDFIFSKEVRFGHYRGQPPPGAEVATQLIVLDPYSKPAYRWRVPYVIVCGSGNAHSRLVDLAVDPLELLTRGSSLKINSTYYITKCINPALDRVLGLAGADINGWYNSLAKRSAIVRYINYDEHEVHINRTGTDKDKVNSDGSTRPKRKFKQRSFEMFTLRQLCVICGNLSSQGLCPACSLNAASTMMVLHESRRLLYEREDDLKSKCSRCSKHTQHAELFAKNKIIGRDCCESINCSTMLDRWKTVLRIEDNELAFASISTEKN